MRRLSIPFQRACPGNERPWTGLPGNVLASHTRQGRLKRNTALGRKMGTVGNNKETAPTSVPLLQEIGKSIARKLRKKKRKPLDFAAAHTGFQQRNDFILERLGAPPKWVLDIGSNQGDTCNALGDRGHFALGVEMFREEWRHACANAHPHAAFLNVSASPEFIDSTPRWDAVLLLSVLHRVYAFSGKDEMLSLLSACGKKTDLIFVEGSTRHARYTDRGERPPKFADLDVESADDWHREVFLEALGSAWDIAHTAFLPCSEIEPNRILYSLEHRDHEK